jgi:hypothetical protein
VELSPLQADEEAFAGQASTPGKPWARPSISRRVRSTTARDMRISHSGSSGYKDRSSARCSGHAFSWVGFWGS